MMEIRRKNHSLSEPGVCAGALGGIGKKPLSNLIKSRPKSHSGLRAGRTFVRKGRDRLTPDSCPNLFVFSLLFKFSHFPRFQHFLPIKTTWAGPAPLPNLFKTAGQMFPQINLLKTPRPASPSPKISAIVNS